MASELLKALRKSTVKACGQCISKGLAVTDHPIEEMHKTRQNWLCTRHYKEWQLARQRHSSRLGLTTTKVIAK